MKRIGATRCRVSPPLVRICDEIQQVFLGKTMRAGKYASGFPGIRRVRPNDGAISPRLLYRLPSERRRAVVLASTIKYRGAWQQQRQQQQLSSSPFARLPSTACPKTHGQKRQEPRRRHRQQQEQRLQLQNMSGASVDGRSGSLCFPQRRAKHPHQQERQQPVVTAPASTTEPPPSTPTNLERFVPLDSAGGGTGDGLPHGHGVRGSRGGEELLEVLAVQVRLGKDKREKIAPRGRGA